MAFGAHVVPILLQTGPVQGVFMRQVLVGIEMEPTLSALLLRAAVPGDAQRLIAAVGETDQVLLQGVHAEGVGDFVVLQGSVRSIGANHEFPIAAKEGGSDAGIAEGDVMEITEHTRFGGELHGLRMLGILPVPIFGRMAFRTALRADVTTIGGRNGRMVVRQRHGQGFHRFASGPRPADGHGQTAKQDERHQQQGYPTGKPSSKVSHGFFERLGKSFGPYFEAGSVLLILLTTNI